mgnify:CR=1 FL=1
MKRARRTLPWLACLCALQAWLAPVGDPFRPFQAGARGLGLGGAVLSADCGAEANNDNPATLYAERTVEFSIGSRLSGAESSPYDTWNLNAALQVSRQVAVGLAVCSLSVGALFINDGGATPGLLSQWNLYSLTTACAWRGAPHPRILLQLGANLHFRVSSDEGLLPLQTMEAGAGLLLTIWQYNRVAAVAGASVPLRGPTNSSLPFFRAALTREFPIEKFLRSSLSLSAKYLGDVESAGVSAEYFLLDRLLRLSMALMGSTLTAQSELAGGLGLRVELVKNALTCHVDFGTRYAQAQWTHALQVKLGFAL